MSRQLTEFEDRRAAAFIDEVEALEHELHRTPSADKASRARLNDMLGKAHKRLGAFIENLQRPLPRVSPTLIGRGEVMPDSAFEAWYSEREGFSLRAERLTGPKDELQAAFEAGQAAGCDGYAVRGFMDKVDFECELGGAMGGNKVYPSEDDCARCNAGCIDQCGMVEVEVRLVRVVRPDRFGDDEPSPSLKEQERT